MGFGVSFSKVLALDKCLTPFTCKSAILALGCEPGTIKHVFFKVMKDKENMERLSTKQDTCHLLMNLDHVTHIFIWPGR